MSDKLSSILFRLMTAPLQSQIKIDFDEGKKIFRLSVPLLQFAKEIPLPIQGYLASTKGMTFRPHQTSYLQQENQIFLVQEIPFHQWGVQPAMRNQVLEFWHLARHCHKMLLDMASDEQVVKIEGDLEG